MQIVSGGSGRRRSNPLPRDDNDVLVAVAETRMPTYEISFRLGFSVHKDLPVQPVTVSA